MPKAGRIAELVVIGFHAMGVGIALVFMVALLPLWLPFAAVGWLAERCGYELPETPNY